MGGVFVTNLPDAPLNVPLPLGATLRDAIEALGARALDTDDEAPSVFHRRAAARARPRLSRESGIRRLARRRSARARRFRGRGRVCHAVGADVAAAIAVSEAFFFVRGRTPIAGRRKVGLSLWRPASRDWLSSHGEEPVLKYLPSSLWLIGLGHLGQAYLWALNLLPYPRPTGAALVLQDER